MIYLLVIVTMSWVHSLFATTVRVPDDYVTIQSALENILPNDTVRVSGGFYPEALVSPDIPFLLFGELAADSVDPLRPIIDPSSLPDANTLSCMFLFGSNVVVENFTFRNGLEMFPHTPSNEGGVIVSGDSCTFRNCSFDSTSIGIYSTSAVAIQLDHCNFKNCGILSVSTAFAQLSARNCNFNSRGVSCGPNSQFFECSFDSISTSYALRLSGPSHLEDCIFHSHDAIGMSTIEGSNVSGEILGSSFSSCSPSMFALGFIRDCSADLLIENTSFSDITPHSQAGRTISFGCTGNTTGGFVTLRNNTFIHCNGNSNGKCFRTGNDSSAVVFERNRFIDNFGNGSAVSLNSNGSQLRDNVFINNGYALSSLYSCDARLNFWGDPSGPYNETHNPSGLGDRVSDSVIFDAWYSDTLFLTDIDPTPIELPHEFSLSVYPNPFNSTTRIALEAPNSFIASIELINILGQRVREIHHGPVLGHQEFSLTISDLPSGIYFANIRDALKKTTLSTQKIALIK
jgi:hypothetical protein